MTRVDPRERFTKAAALYARCRPSYPAEAIDWIVAAAKLAPVASVVDLGCGTGISTRLFAARGLDVVGIDPNEEMLAHARAAGGGRYLRGEAAATGLSDRSVDLAVAAQAFHWFDLAPTFAELRRILRGDGWVAAFWNQRRSSPLTDALDELLVAHSGEYRALGGHDEVGARIRAHPGLGSIAEASFAHEGRLDWEHFRGRVESSSYVVHGVDDRAAFEQALGELFDGHAAGGLVTWPLRTDVLAFRLV
jgi:SAM-dependent methyltransferase